MWDTLYIRGHCTLIKFVAIDRFRENLDCEVIAKAIASESPTGRGAAHESDLSTERVNISGDRFMSHFFEDRVCKATIQKLLAEYIEMYDAYDSEEETKESAVDVI
jgi:hypothetical protein